MDVHEFLKTRPCLEELDGYLDALRYQIANPELFHRLQYNEITGDVLGPLEACRQRLMSGKEVPTPTRLDRVWDYKVKSKPKRKRVTHEDQPQAKTEEPQSKSRGPSLDLNARRPQRGRDVRFRSG